MRLNFVTAVWGETYARLLCDLSVRTLVADKNFPCVNSRADISYRIYTNTATAPMLEANPNWSLLQRAVNVEILLHDINYRDPIGSHHDIWAHALDHARKTRAAVVFIAPDTMWANGAISRIVDLFANGHAGLFFPGFRVGNDTFYKTTIRDYPVTDATPITLSPVELMRRAMEHMHPLKTVFLRHSTMYPDHMENLLWPVGDQGFVLRQYITHSLFGINPSEIEVNNYSVPTRSDQLDRIYWATGSDDVLFVSLGPIARDLHWYEYGERVVANRLAMKSLEIDSPIVLPLMQRKFRFHSGITNESEWRAVERASDLLTHRVRVARESLRIWGELDKMGCATASQLLLLALFGRGLSHAVKFQGSVTVFCPIDKSLPREGSADWVKLTRASERHQLRRLLLSHVVPGRFDLNSLKRLQAPSRLPASQIVIEHEGDHVLANGVQIVRSKTVGEHVIHEVEAPVVRATCA